MIKRLLEVGYLLNKDLKKVEKKNAKVFKTNIDTAQSIVLTPLFKNVVFDELDEFINKDLKIKWGLLRKFKKVSFKYYNTSNFKRLYYIRYFDDWFILVAGSFKKTKEIYEKLSNLLKSLGLILSLETLYIIALRNDICRFLGINFFICKNTDEYYKPILLIKKNIRIRQRFLSRIVLHAPIEELLIKLKEKGFVKRNNKGAFYAIGKRNCIFLTHSQTLNYFNSLIQGIFNYYVCVQNRNAL